MTAQRPLVLAHRGASGEYPEHTRAAMLRAIEVGADGVECDVQLTADGELVCLHDTRVDRTSDGTGRVGSFTLAQLKALDWGSWRSIPEGSGDDAHTLVTLEDLLDIVTSRPRELILAIETKHPSHRGRGLEAAVMALLQRFGLGPSTSLPVSVRLISFSATALGRARALSPLMPLGFLTNRADLLAPRGRAAAAGSMPKAMRGHAPDTEIIAPGLDLLRARPELVEAAHAAGREVQAWTIDDPEDVAWAQEIGVDLITTNRPAQVLAQLTGDR